MPAEAGTVYLGWLGLRMLFARLQRSARAQRLARRAGGTVLLGLGWHLALMRH